VLAQALTQARDARLHILDVMLEAIAEPDEMSPYARGSHDQDPGGQDRRGDRAEGPDHQRHPGRDRCRDHHRGRRHDLRGATDGPSAQAAVDRINAIANPQMPQVGERYLARS